MSKKERVKVIHVVNGNTFVGKDADGKELWFRLHEVDTPEEGELGYDEATDALRNIIGDHIWIDRLLVTVKAEMSNEKSVNTAMREYNKK